MKISAIEAKKKGFLSRDNLVGVNEGYYYLWLCELQKWLSEQHKIIVWVSPYLQVGDIIQFNYQYIIRENDSFQHCSHEKEYPNQEEALEAGLMEVLKTIPDVI